MNRRQRQTEKGYINSYLMIFFTFLFAGIIITRLFYLQIIRGEYYQTQAEKDHQAQTELPARRGEIFIQDYHSGDKFRVATNTTLNLLFADPTLIKNKELVANTIAEIIFDEQEEREKEQKRIQELRKTLPADASEELLAQLNTSTTEQLYQKFHQNLLEAISAEKRAQILLSSDLPENAQTDITNRGLPGIEATEGKLYAYPPQISDYKEAASFLSPYLNIPKARLERILIGQNRYVVLKKKLPPELAERISEIKNNDENEDFIGINMKEEYYRYYPEETLAANVLGFVDHNGNGQYGIESSFNKELEGKKGIFQTKIDSTGRHITVGDSIIEPAVNGSNITLTIDRSIQMVVEEKLAQRVNAYNADSGQVIVMEPETGKIIAMAHYPSFDPNNYNSVFATEIINLTPEQVEQLVPLDEEDSRFAFYRNTATYDKYDVFKEVDEFGNTVYKRFKNFFGPEVYQNKTVSGIYEPGSVMKSIAMAIALDDKDVTPNETFLEDGPIKVDEFEIRNSLDKYRGIQTMTNVLEQSSNTGMAYVARKVGRTLLYNYYKQFGFSERTDIEFDNEHAGQLEHSSQWAESELVTRSFGQGVAVTPIQMITAYAALANDGILMKPYIVQEVENQDGKITKTEPKILHRVIDEKTAETITAMLVSAVENGVANHAQVPGHFVAGKTGTSQTYKHGKPLEGPGTTITSFAGYAPVDDPKFVVLVKIDRPRADIWGSTVAAPLFADIADYLFKYYSLPADK